MEGTKSDEALLTANEVLLAFQDAGLPVTNPRDNTSKNCKGDFDCIGLMTTEDVSIHSWPSEERAKQVHNESGFGDLQSGNITISINNKSLEANVYSDILNSVVKN